MKKLAYAIGAVAALGMSQHAAAAATCQGTLIANHVDADGNVYVMSSWRSDYTQICNARVTWKGIAPEVCLLWLAKVDAAVSLEREVLIYYASETNCATLPTYAATSAPTYVMLR